MKKNSNVAFPTVSIFTPTHDTKFLLDVYASIKDQDFHEWVIVYNNGAKPINFNDSRVKTTHFVSNNNEYRIGELKKVACDSCTGDILLELDHDDLLMPTAIKEVQNAFKSHPDVGFVYSNALYCDLEFNNVQRFDESNGWQYKQVKYNGHRIDMPLSFPPTPASVSRIWYAPDHLRAYRKTVYDSVGGFDSSLKVLDDQDLMCRMYQATKFHHIPKGLYVYRVHGENSWLKYNQEIQDGVWPLYDKYIEPMALKWAGDNQLTKCELGGRINSSPGYQTVDLRDADICADLNELWPFKDNSVGVIRAYDVFEHLRSPIHTMKELYRVLAPGGYAFLQIPSTDGRGAFQDPTHISFWNENSFLYYTHRDWAKYIDTPVRFQCLRCYTTSPDLHGVSWTIAHLISLKGAHRPPGIINI